MAGPAPAPTGSVGIPPGGPASAPPPAASGTPRVRFAPDNNRGAVIHLTGRARPSRSQPPRSESVRILGPAAPTAAVSWIALLQLLADTKRARSRTATPLAALAPKAEAGRQAEACREAEARVAIRNEHGSPSPMREGGYSGSSTNGAQCPISALTCSSGSSSHSSNPTTARSTLDASRALSSARSGSDWFSMNVSVSDVRRE